VRAAMEGGGTPQPKLRWWAALIIGVGAMLFLLLVGLFLLWLWWQRGSAKLAREEARAAPRAQECSRGLRSGRLGGIDHQNAMTTAQRRARTRAPPRGPPGRQPRSVVVYALSASLVMGAAAGCVNIHSFV